MPDLSVPQSISTLGDLVLVGHIHISLYHVYDLVLGCSGTVTDADRQAAVARASAYARVQKLTANPPKTFPIKTRGPNSKKSTSDAKADDVIELD